MHAIRLRRYAALTPLLAGLLLTSACDTNTADTPATAPSGNTTTAGGSPAAGASGAGPSGAATAASLSPAASALVEKIRSSRFVAEDATGYGEQVVDDFLDEIIASINAGTPMPASTIRGKRFTIAGTGNRGYSRKQVDDFMAEVAGSIGASQH